MRLSIFQSAGGSLTPEQRFGRLREAIAASVQGDTKPDLVVCPELFTSGYNVAHELISLAETPRGPTFERIAAIAREFQAAIVYGYPEQDNGHLYNSAAFVSAQGELVINHRKQLNSPGSFEEDYFTPGDQPSVVQYRDWRIAVLICYEVEFPEAVRNAALAGAQVVLVPTALIDQWDVVASRVVPARAFENGVWLAYANHSGHENGFDYLGGSKIVAPDGVIEADAGEDEGLISTIIDIDRVVAAQQRLPYLRDCSKYKIQ